MDALADRYFTRRVPPAWFRPGKERQEFAIKLAKEYEVDGVIWYQMMARESDDFESYWYPDVLKKGANAPMLKLTSDYDSVERGQFSTRLETFIESIRS
jgi:benzoyl-CoA reductase/2-hydroxyglutaryl-CoA dehydratase subunit BcrC/BadD/HgdB